MAINRTALRCVGVPNDTAKVVTFLASGHAAWITGEVIAASGGSRQAIADALTLTTRSSDAQIHCRRYRRKRSLVDMGYAADLGDGRIRAPKDLLRRLEAVDIDRAGRALAVESGRQWQPAIPGNDVSGRLVGATRLASGRDIVRFCATPSRVAAFPISPGNPVTLR